MTKYAVLYPNKLPSVSEHNFILSARLFHVEVEKMMEYKESTECER